MGACTAVFVRWKIGGGYAVWQGSTENDDPVPAVGSQLHYGVFVRRGDALCEAHDRAGELPVICLPEERPKPATVEDLRRLIADDAWAATFLTLADYRQALMKAARNVL
jgi:hypothetical protein